MAQGDYLIQNQTFPSFRTDLNSTLEAINTSNSGTSRPSSAVAGTIWLDTTSATTPTLKFYDGTDDISLATLDYTANTVNWLDSTVVFDIVGDTTPQLGGNLDVNGNSLVSTSNGDITFTPNGSGKVVISGLSFPTSDGSADQVLKTDGSGNLSFTDVSGGTSWQSVQTTGFTAVAGEGYPCNTTSAGFTVTLPSTPSAGDQVQIVDYAGTFDTNTLVIDGNGENIEGLTSQQLLTGERSGVILTYIDSTQGWITTSGINEGTNALEPNTYSIDFLVIAGGGGGGENAGGGGGAGGYRTSTQTVNATTVITVTVGDGGASNTNGSNSSISGSSLTTITSAGGGNGGNLITVGGSGGSGGGGGTGFFNGPFGAGGSGNTPSTSPSQGNNGGSGADTSQGSPYNELSGGGGGGAGATGNAGVVSTAGSGGNGLASSITGSSVTRAGGGGGGSYTTAGAGGSGGGGAGGYTYPNDIGTAGTINTGSGGGGNGSGGGAGGAGGKGVVILSMPDAKYSGTTTGSPTVATGVSGKTVLTFTGSGSYTA